MDIKYPDLKTRVQSTFIDVVFMVVLMFGAAWVLDKFNGEKENDDGWIRAIIFVGIWGIYEPLTMTIGCTLGNYLMKIRIRKISNVNKTINIFQAFVRFIFKVFLGWLSFISIHFNEERRAIHDFAAGSVMIEK